MYYLDINECKTLDKCGKNSVCINVPGSYRCRCNKGYTEDNGVCVGLYYITPYTIRNHYVIS